MNEEVFETAEMYPISTKYMCLYGVNTNIQRAIPDVYDGLKPVHRRLLYTMIKNYPRHGKASVATLGGEVLKYHPHGDLGMRDIIAGMAQSFSNNIPLFIAHGNAGTKDEDIGKSVSVILHMMCYLMNSMVK